MTSDEPRNELNRLLPPRLADDEGHQEFQLIRKRRLRLHDRCLDYIPIRLMTASPRLYSQLPKLVDALDLGGLALNCPEYVSGCLQNMQRIRIQFPRNRLEYFPVEARNNPSSIRRVVMSNALLAESAVDTDPRVFVFATC